MSKDYFINNKIHKLILVIMFLSMSFVLVMSGVSKTFAGELDIKNNVSSLTNIGFMENPPKELKEKFPMCDAFLKVEWIDKEKKIGYSYYDLYKDGKKDGQMTALIYLNQYYPHFDYDLNEYNRKGKLEDIFSFIRKGEIVGKEQLLTIKQGSKKITFWATIGQIGVNGPTFLNHHKNVCIPYPDNQLMWIVEGRQVGKVYTDQQIKERYEILQKYFAGLPLLRFKEMNVIDLNYDGDDDYFFYFPWLSYSHKDQYFKTEKSGAGFNYIELYFSHSKKTCKLQPHGLDYLTTNGKNYFLSNQCDLTELTR